MKALSPAKVKEVRIHEDTGTAEVIVPDYQLSLAIGKEGQNARLAARLTGWRVDIKSETQLAEEEANPPDYSGEEWAEGEWVENPETGEMTWQPAEGGPAVTAEEWQSGDADVEAGDTDAAETTDAGATGATAYIDLRDTTEPERLEGCETLTTVCLDSLEVVAGDAGWNAALFRLYTLMQDLRGRLVVASRAAPASIAFRLPDLRSRLLAADSWQLQELDDDDQVRALQLRAERRGLTLADDAALFLVHRLPRDMHSLCRVLDQLDEASLVAQRRLTMPFLRQALAAQVDAAGSADD